jgi:hypothetical protein
LPFPFDFGFGFDVGLELGAGEASIREMGAGEELVRDVEASGLLVAGGGGGGGVRSSSSSEEHRSIISLFDLACCENLALRLGPLLGGIALGVGSFPLRLPLPDEIGGREDDTDAVLDEGGLRRTFLLILSREGNGEVGGGGVSVESLLAEGLYSSGSSSSDSDVIAR